MNHSDKAAILDGKKEILSHSESLKTPKHEIHEDLPAVTPENGITSHIKEALSSSSHLNMETYSNNVLNNLQLYNLGVPVQQAIDIANGMNFSYSQKFFHVADGNLYSIFSPLQGRSYGAKPSFLKKQRYTIEECCQRGRNSMQKGLKFHNFVPSQNPMPEGKDLNTENLIRTQRKCKLREEHGTKQIMLSSWCAPSSKQASTLKENDKSSLQVVKDENHNFTLHIQDTKNSELNENTDEESSSVSNDALFNNSANNMMIQLPSLNADQSSLELLNNSLNETSKDDSNATTFVEETLQNEVDIQNLSAYKCDNSLVESREFNESMCSMNYDYTPKRSRRKQLQTKRIVPYTKYLSLLEENKDTPLDLSYHPKFAEKSNNKLKSKEISKIRSTNIILDLKQATEANNKNLCSSKLDSLIQMSQNSSNSERSFSDDCNIIPKRLLETMLTKSTEQTKISQPNSLTYVCPVNVDQNIKIANSFQNLQSTSRKISTRSKTNGITKSKLKALNSVPNSLSQIVLHNETNQPVLMLPSQKINFLPGSSAMHTFTPTSAFAAPEMNCNKLQDAQGPLITDIRIPRSQRRCNQRTAIRQKLEDAFRQNGFLVKTKQVSDGEATFCKFRQLRKYTRYYLKSWQQHLPEELHKLWKGFLPPKTTLPTIARPNDA